MQRPLWTYAFGGEETIQLLDVEVTAPEDRNPALTHAGQGAFNKRREALDIRCADGTQITVLKVRQRNKKLITGREWWNGVWQERKPKDMVQFTWRLRR